MSILKNKEEYQKALNKAHLDFPHKNKYDYTPSKCHHNFNFVIYCDGGDWDIVRCNLCGEERIFKCDFDDEYC